MFAKMQSLTLILFIALTLLLALFQPLPQVAMRRESQVDTASLHLQAQPATLEEALNLSLAMGDYRKVDFAPFGLSWEA